MSARILGLVAGLLALTTLASCTVTPPKDYDYRAYLEHMPRSILVLPPLDESPDVEGCYGWLSSVTRRRPSAATTFFPWPSSTG